MCGINGIAYSSNSNRQADKSVLRKMRDCLRHRGPDDFRANSEKNRNRVFAVKDYDLQMHAFIEDLRIGRIIESAKTGMPIDLEAILENKIGTKSSAE